jgi:hypothetical protein
LRSKTSSVDVVHEALRRRKADAAVRTRYERNFSVEFTHE